MGRPFGSKGKKPRKDKSPIPLYTRKAAACKKHEKTLQGYLMRTYRNMKSRVKGVQKKKAHLYIGLSLLEKADFYEWSLSLPAYHELYKNWVESGYSRKLSPSIDRIDSKKGYEKGNMRWITHSQNSKETNRWQLSPETSILT